MAMLTRAEIRRRLRNRLSRAALPPLAVHIANATHVSSASRCPSHGPLIALGLLLIVGLVAVGMDLAAKGGRVVSDPIEERRLTIARAIWDAHSRRPYAVDPNIVKAITPGGGDWECVVRPGSIVRTIMWRGAAVATMNPDGNLLDKTEGHIAMAMRAMPIVDYALRAILVLADAPEDAEMIRQIAISTLATIELPAPPIPELGDEADEDAEDDVYGSHEGGL